MDLSVYIGDLLFKHDCVIVPGLGGFVTNYQPASIQNNHTFIPPSKGISFNKHLTNNDGLLANEISQKEDVSFEEATNRINVSIVELQKELNSSKKAELNGVGTLSLDNENRIHFTPSSTINYLLDSYGLSSFQQFPVVRKTLEEKVVQAVKEAPVVPIEGRKRSRKWAVAAAITIPLAFFAIWLPSQVDLTGELNYASLNPFRETIQTYVPAGVEFKFKEVNESNVAEQLKELESNNAESVAVQFVEGESPIVVTNTIAEAVSTKVEATVKLRYHIVAGCFSSKRNAKKMVKKLVKAGFEAWIVGQRKGLYTVSYSSFATRKEAVDALVAAKGHNSKAWILEY